MSRRAAFVGVLAVLAAIAIIAGNATLSRPAAVAEPAAASAVLPGEAASGVWFCPGLPPTLDAGDQRVTLTNVGTTPADIVVTVLPDRGAPIRRTMTVGASSVTNTRRRDLGPPGAVTVETFGGTVVVEQGVDGGAGIDLSPCATRSATRWEFAAGSTLRGVQQWLVIDDPFASDAKVDITLRTNAGIRRPERLQGFDIASRSRAVIPIHDFAVRNERVAVEVDARVGRVVAGQTLVFTADAGATGVATTVGAPQPSDHWMFSEGASVNGTTSFVAIVNGGDDDAQVSVQAVTANAQPVAPVMVTVGRDDVEWVQLGNCAANSPNCVPVPDGAAYGLDVRSDGGVPIVAQALGRGTDQAAAPGATTAIGQTVAARRTAFASSRVDGEQETTLTLVNPFATQVDARVALVHGGAVARPDALQKIALPPGRRVTVTIVDENTRSADNNALVVEAGGPVIVERTMAGAGDVSRSPGVSLP